MTKKLHACIVLDRSGSMENCRTDAVGAVNSYLRQTKDDTTVDARISLIIFDSESINIIRDRAPAGSCNELLASEYEPRGGTPLLDAVGHGVALLDKAPDKDERHVLAIMTDGMENASREHTKESIKALLDRKQREDGWLVMYLGADHDSWSQAAQLGLSAGNVASFAKSAMRASMQSMKVREKRYVDSATPHLEASRGGFTNAERQQMSPAVLPRKGTKTT